MGSKPTATEPTELYPIFPESARALGPLST